MSKILPSLVLLALIPSAAVAQITPDSSLGAENSIVDSNGDRDTIEGGAIRDANLFHSFQEFNVGAGREAYFANPNGIANIFSRVTGNNLSNILGTLGVLGDANLFFLNPNGIVFGPNARLDVRGSFVGSTADSLVFDNGFEFSASNPQVPPLLTVNIPIGLKFRDNPGSIDNQSVAIALDNNNNVVGLQVQPGNSLALVGGEVNLDGGTLTAAGGRVELGGVSAAGTIGLNSDGSLSFPDDVARADVSIINGAIIDVLAGGGGSITVNARNLEVREGSQLLAGIREGLGTPEAQAGDITINATDSVKFDGKSRAFSRVNSGAVGNAGSVLINTGFLEVTNGAQLQASTLGTGSAGTITIKATDRVVFDGESSRGFVSGAFSQVRPGASGNAGGIEIYTPSLTVSNGATLNASTFGVKNAGTVKIEASDFVLFDGESRRPGIVSGAFSQVSVGASGNAGGIEIYTPSLTVSNGALLSASNRGGTGNAGTVKIEASDSVLFDGQSSQGLPGGVISVAEGAVGVAGGIEIETASLKMTNGAVLNTSNFGRGDAGNVTIKAASLKVTNGATLNANTLGRGDAGSVTINATDFVKFDGEGGFSGAFSQVLPEAEGQGGDVSITTGSLEVLNGAQLSASTFAVGDAGSVTINATDFVKFDGEGGFSGAFSQVLPEAEGQGGYVSITTGSLEVLNGARVSARTRGVGDAGNVILKVKDNITLSGSDTGIFANTDENSTGQGGSIIIDPRTLTIRDSATISVDSQGEGIGGDIELAAGFLTLDNGTISAETRSNTGGNITLNLQDLLLLRNDSQISTTAGNQEFGGDGGNLTINTPFIVAFPDENSDITANAFEGSGGQINITAQGIFGIEERKASEENQTNDIDASSEFGLAGVVEINQPDVDPNRGLVELPETVVDPNALVAQNACKQGSESEFVITGRGGLPPSLNEDLSSDATQVGLVEPAPMESRGAREQGSSGGSPRYAERYPLGRRKTQGNVHQDRRTEDKTSSSPSVPATIIPAQGWVFNDKGEVVLVAYDPTVTGSQRLKKNPPGCSAP